MTSIDTAPALISAPEAAPTSPRKPKAKTGNITTDGPAPNNPTAKPTIPITKSATVIKLLSRTKGATVEELVTETSWQRHSVRAFFTGLRKKGHALVREQRRDGVTCYRLAAAKVEMTATAPTPQPAAASPSPEGTNSTGAAA